MRTVIVHGKSVKTDFGGWVVDYANGRPSGRLERSSPAALRRRKATRVAELCVLVDGQWLWLPTPCRERKNAPIAFKRGVPVPAERVTQDSGL